MCKIMKEDELSKVSGGLTVNGDGTYSLTTGEVFETAPQGDRFVYEVQVTCPNATLDSYIKVYLMEYKNNDMVNGEIKMLPLKEIFDNCNINY